MMVKKTKRHILLLILGLVCFFMIGCGTKYGNLSQDPVKDIPQVQPQKTGGLPEINADEYEKLGDAMLS
ncbi:MAG: hypothetical protein KOO65_13010, partial [Desulfobacterales bacterium]|nr:hypothetical protein [Desulfobacterales bacterium]